MTAEIGILSLSIFNAIFKYKFLILGEADVIDALKKSYMSAFEGFKEQATQKNSSEIIIFP